MKFIHVFVRLMTVLLSGIAYEQILEAAIHCLPFFDVHDGNTPVVLKQAQPPRT